MRAKLRDHPEMIVEAGTAKTRAWPPCSGFVSTDSTTNPPRNLGACILSGVSLTEDRINHEEQLFVDLLCNGGELHVMVPLHSKPAFQSYIATILEGNVGRTLADIDEIEIEWPRPQGNE